MEASCCSTRLFKQQMVVFKLRLVLRAAASLFSSSVLSACISITCFGTCLSASSWTKRALWAAFAPFPEASLAFLEALTASVAASAESQTLRLALVSTQLRMAVHGSLDKSVSERDPLSKVFFVQMPGRKELKQDNSSSEHDNKEMSHGDQQLEQCRQLCPALSMSKQGGLMHCPFFKFFLLLATTTMSRTGSWRSSSLGKGGFTTDHHVIVKNSRQVLHSSFWINEVIQTPNRVASSVWQDNHIRVLWLEDNLSTHFFQSLQIQKIFRRHGGT